MITLSQFFQLGEVCIHLHIVAHQLKTMVQLENLLVPLLPFQCKKGSGDISNLRIMDGLVSDYNQNYKLANPGDFLAASRDSRIFTIERILFSVMLLATRQHILNNGLCLHAAAVSRHARGFLFLGESGAGKSTISSLSAEIGIPVLAEDRVFLLNNKSGYLLAAGPHPTSEYVNYSDARPLLKGIFVIFKDQFEYIKPISHVEASKFLFAAVLQNSAMNYLPNDILELAFKTVCNVGRKIPAFELHFRKTPNFWKLIDEQFQA